MNILITPSIAIENYIKTRMQIDFTYDRLSKAVFEMIDREETNVFAMLSPTTVSDLKHATYFHIQLSRPDWLIGKALTRFNLKDVEACDLELLEVEAKTVDRWPLLR
jgi:hypothetical protein